MKDYQVWWMHSELHEVLLRLLVAGKELESKDKEGT